jgi:hypothetical protein
MSALLEFAGAPATKCVASGTHIPRPLRFVWHHVQPHEAGGPTEAANLVELCDTCHYSIHRILWVMRLMGLGQVPTAEQHDEYTYPPRMAQKALAERGYEACVAAGTVAQIPNEG